MKRSNGKSDRNGEERYTVPEWEPAARIKRQGKAHTPNRKVITNGGTKRISMDPTRFAKMLRGGCEVRFADRGGNEWLRLFPLLSIDCRTIKVQAQTMGEFRSATYSGLGVKLSHRGKDVSASYCKRMFEDAAEERSGLVHVTPDTVVECPNCGFEFRVGKVLN